jgi:superfamily I DNA/RNA helicase
VLRANYRNAKEILETAMGVVGDDSFEDIDGTRTPGQRDVELVHRRGGVTRVVAPTLGLHDEALLAALRARAAETHRADESPVPPWGDQALLCPSRRMIADYERLLAQAKIPLCSLEHYDGQPVDAVKIGSYTRAKGLEFKHVYLPQHGSALQPRASEDSEPDAARERRSLARSQLFVAMTRARPHRRCPGNRDRSGIRGPGGARVAAHSCSLA